jgi:hypothetical protein
MFALRTTTLWVFTLAAFACNGGSPATSPADGSQSSSAQFSGNSNAANPASGTSTNNSKQSTIEQLYGPASTGPTPASIRGAQKAQLQSEIQALESEYEIGLQNLALLTGEDIKVLNKAIPTVASGSWQGDAAQLGIDVTAGGAAAALAGGLSKGATGALTGAIQAGGDLISTVLTKQNTQNIVNQTSAQVQQNISDLTANLVNLQRQMNEKQAEISTLNAQGTN